MMPKWYRLGLVPLLISCCAQAMQSAKEKQADFLLHLSSHYASNNIGMQSAIFYGLFACWCSGSLKNPKLPANQRTFRKKRKMA